MSRFIDYGEKNNSIVTKIKHSEPGAVNMIAHYLYSKLTQKLNTNHTPVVLCIGSDRATGDSLGPLTGSNLAPLCGNAYAVIGTLKDPVHALNLEQHINTLTATTKNPFIIAVDASLGSLESVGYIEMGLGSLKPGLAVHKNLPEIGDFYITGIVNIGGFMEQMILQSTRLYRVMQMSEVISAGANMALQEIFGRSKQNSPAQPQFVHHL